MEEQEYAQNIQFPLMNMEPQPGVRPFFARKPHKTPLHWADKVKKEVKKLITARIIEGIPANEQAQWISPAGFIAKDKKEEKLRFICNLRQLNESFKNDCSIFPITKEVMKSLKSTSKYFIRQIFSRDTTKYPSPLKAEICSVLHERPGSTITLGLPWDTLGHPTISTIFYRKYWMTSLGHTLRSTIC